MSESFLDYRKRMQKLEHYRAWEAENKKTFYLPQKVREFHWGDKAAGGFHWGDTPVDSTFRMNIRRCDIPAFTDED